MCQITLKYTILFKFDCDNYHIIRHTDKIAKKSLVGIFILLYFKTEIDTYGTVRLLKEAVICSIIKNFLLNNSKNY